MKPFRRTLVFTIMASGLITIPAAAQGSFDAPDWRAELERTKEKLGKLDSDWQGKIDKAAAQMDRVWPMLEKLEIPNFKINIQPLMQLKGMDLAFLPQDGADRAREAQERVREAQERVRDAADRVRDREDRNVESYRSGISDIDDRKYERAIDRFDRVIEAKWARADGAYYWKAYALNKLGKRDEALAALGEIPKQFPQSRWINDANALKAEIQQASGTAASPENQSDEDLRLLAINGLMNSEPERAVPLLEKVINDPKNNLGLKGRALFVLAQSRSDKARDIVAQYAKNGSNPDLQIRAVQYLGTYRSKDSQQTLADVYASVSDVSVKRAVLRSMFISHDVPHLLNAAKSESNLELRQEAIRNLGMLQATNELGQLYASETNVDLKDAMIQSLFVGKATDRLIEIAKTEKDARLRATAIHRLGTTRNEKAGEALAGIYASEPDKGVKSQILQAVWMQGNCKQLVDMIRSEKDRDLKADGVRRLGQMKGCKEASDYLMELISK
jgi:tetratricopeptide (TPR) repeat protein